MRRVLTRVLSSRRGLWFCVFVPLALLYLATLRVSPLDMSADPAAVTPSAWQLAHHGTPRIPSSVEPFAYHNDWLIPSGTDSVVSNREPGLVLVALPFQLIFYGAGIGSVWPAGIAAALVSAAAMATVALVARRFVSALAAAGAGLIGGLATTTWAISGTALWPHGPDQLFLAIALATAASGTFAWTGLAYACAILVRPHLAIVGAVVGVWQSWCRRAWWPAVLIGAVSACGLAVLLWYSHRYWQGGLDSQYVATGGSFIHNFFDLHPAALGKFALNILGTLGSPGRGVLFGAPFLIVLLPGLRAAWYVAPPWVRSAAVGGVLYLLVQLKANRFSGGDRFWSYRYPLETLTLMAPLFILAWRDYVRPSRHRAARFSALVVLSTALQAIGALCFRGPYTGKSWLPADLIAALTQSRGWLGCVILVAGFFSAGLVFGRITVRGELAEGNDDHPESSPR